jgi:hypothetical protein
MNLARVYANGVVLPDGKVLITGGAQAPKEFSDDFAHDQPGAALDSVPALFLSCTGVPMNFGSF